MYRLPESVRQAQARIAKFMALGQRKGRWGNPAQLVCAACGADWVTSSPGDCSRCGKFSYAVSKGS